IRDARRDGETQLGERGSGEPQRGHYEEGREFFHAVVHEVGANVSSKLRSNSAGSGGDGSGDARYTAASTDSRNAASPPLQLSTRTEVTSPPGTWVTETVQEMPGCAEGGLIQARWMRA